MSLVWMILYIGILVGACILMFTFGRKYVFSKYRVNKWILLAIAVVLFLAQYLLKVQNQWIMLLITILILWFFIWFLDIQTTGGPKKPEKKIEIKSKAKPNRVKHLQNKNNK